MKTLCSESDSSTLDHEIAHGLYYTCEKYKTAVDKVLAKMKPAHVESMNKFLVDMGYAESVLLDETQAYMGTSPDYLQANGIEFDMSIAEKIKKLFDEHLEKSK